MQSRHAVTTGSSGTVFCGAGGRRAAGLTGRSHPSRDHGAALLRVALMLVVADSVATSAAAGGPSAACRPRLCGGGSPLLTTASGTPPNCELRGRGLQRALNVGSGRRQRIDAAMVHDHKRTIAFQGLNDVPRGGPDGGGFAVQTRLRRRAGLRKERSISEGMVKG